jgi:PmbA protein
VISRDGDAMHRDSWGISRRHAGELPPVASVVEHATQRALRRVGARKIHTQRVPVIFHADIASGLISSLLSAISGGALFRRSSFLLDSLGQEVLPAFIDITERPRELRGYASACIDGDGLPTRDQAFVSAGRVARYLLGTYSSRKLSMPSTANAGGARNVRVSGSSGDFNALVKTMHKGLIVTEVMGQGVNLVSGDYSRGAAGFWVENGDIVHPVHEVTIAGNMKDMFRHLVGHADDIDTRGNIHCGSLLVESMMVGGS